MPAKQPLLTLVSHPLCPYVQRAAIVLAEKGVPFDRRTVDLAAKPHWFLMLSPLGKTPLLLVHRSDGTEVALFESVAICEYLDETQAGPRMLPADPLERARHHAWVEFGSSVLAELWGFETAKDRATFETRRWALQARFARVEADWLAGPGVEERAFGQVDAVFAPIFRYFDVFDALLPEDLFADLPRVAAWRHRLAVRPSVAGAVEVDYAARLRAFLLKHDAWLLRAARTDGAAETVYLAGGQGGAGGTVRQG